MNNYQFAISYTNTDKTFVKELEEQLAKLGYSVFLDVSQYKLLVGKYLHEVLYDVFYNKSKFAILIISKEYFEKNHTMWEARTVIAKSVKIPNKFLIILHDNVSIDEISKKLCINDNYLFMKYGELNSVELAELLADRINENNK